MEQDKMKEECKVGEQLPVNDEQQIINPQELYQNSVRKRKRLRIFVLIVVLGAEILLGNYYVHIVHAHNFMERIAREYQIRTKGMILLETGTYTGETNFGYFFGNGVFLFKTGTEYSGEWEDNQLSGLGTLNVPSEGVYEGNFINSQKSGQGVFSWEDGSVYEGEWKNDKMHGQGVYTSSDDVVYNGTFEENLFWTGECTFTNNTGSYSVVYKDGEIDSAIVFFEDGSVYEGFLTLGGISGTGTFLYSNGDSYTGYFSGDLRSGKGEYIWSSGDTYNGGWKQDMMYGSGTYTFADGSYMNGTFVKNSFTDGTYFVATDFGEYTFTIDNSEAVAVEMTLENGTSYSGDMTEGNLTGTAEIKYSNGDKYAGDVVNGEKSGKGTYTWTSGASYDGEWENDDMSGDGNYYYSESDDGYSLSGTFSEGLPTGKCKYYTDSSTYYQTDWDNGKCVKIYE